MPGVTLPDGLPFGVRVIEAAILDPDFGTMLSHDVIFPLLAP